ncbi:MAG TPA: c-type cytochrome [Phycisphaerae bacterium]|nr:cytochrome c [Phycisphaerales bacterium]HRX87439.1 c-type cytochrome [Phycisphaerae bacterium]
MRKRYWLGVLSGGLGVIIVALVLGLGGAINMEADQPPGLLDGMGHVAWESSVAWRSGDMVSPVTGDANAASDGFEHYRSTCVMCHGAPDVAGAEWVGGMLPMPPNLALKETQERSDAELFHIIHDGVRMTGMPAFGSSHSDRQIWEMVAFLRKLPNLGAAQKASLRSATHADEHEHHAEEHHGS